MINAHDSKSKIIFSLWQKLFTPRESKGNIRKTRLNDWVYCLHQDNCFSVMKQTNLERKINSEQLPSLLRYPWPRLNAAGRWVQKTPPSDQTCSSHPRPRLWCATFSLSPTPPVRGKSQSHVKAEQKQSTVGMKNEMQCDCALKKQTKSDWCTIGWIKQFKATFMDEWLAQASGML